MNRLFLLLFLFGITACETATEDKVASFSTHFETTEGQETATYLQTIDFYIRLAKEFPEINIQTIGETDSGFPLHIVTYNPDGDFNFQKIAAEKAIILINNGIHPGESDGIDATMLLYRDLATGNLKAPKNTVLTTIPVYNIGGALNRNSTTRVNQNGPLAYGFRGNAQNYDLNRDFIKSDTKNARTFAGIFHLVQPDIFIDNHVSNGADYQYTLTHLFTQHNKLGGELGEFLHQELMPELENSLEASGWDITPYVNVFNRPPENGFSQFMDHPRYSTGYTTLWNTFGLMVETHMLKPYKQRVEGTYELMSKLIEIAESNTEKIKELRENALLRHRGLTHYPIRWELDTLKHSRIAFKGFEVDTLLSEVTGFPRLKYDRERPFTKEVTYQNYYRPRDSVLIPEAYVVRKGWEKVMNHLVLNNIEFRVLEKDTSIAVEVYRIADFKTVREPYEGHYLHYDTEVSAEKRRINFQEGDYIVPTDQPGFRYVMETLEPAAMDSFFNWNFFDTVLQQKEDFSPYAFEDMAAEILRNNPDLNEAFLAQKATDSVLSSNWYAQLQWIYQHSEHYEKAHMQYPVYRILK
ncbi:M14 family metallopeptidase [Poritiphilus flavus]|uniref:Peptidase M14 domain-containing protein n=1 Tax=Poritiphilus flavus TaxID=2697053 RepID=A0A6L9EAV2_9FLAO|nr:M14 family metallopeptidase [Poritiphilus flavus]NAS11773.1 hypothetical protein [Poritiphilus flavus]